MDSSNLVSVVASLLAVMGALEVVLLSVRVALGSVRDLLESLGWLRPKPFSVTITDAAKRVVVFRTGDVAAAERLADEIIKPQNGGGA